jgi:DNA mismatch repair protein MutS
MSLFKEYFELTKKYIDEYGEQTVLFMLVGDFFQVYGKQTDSSNIGSKIYDVAQICDLNLTSKNNYLMIGFNDFRLEKYVKKLQQSNYTIVVYRQDEETNHTTRSLYEIYSPGTYFSIDENQKITNHIVCIWINKYIHPFYKEEYVVIGISNIDIYTGKSSIYEYKEKFLDCPTTYDDVERFLSIYNPSEMILIHNLSEKELEHMILYSEIKCSLIHKIQLLLQDNDTDINVNKKRAYQCEKQTYQKEILIRFFKPDDIDVFMENFYSYTIATQSYCYLLDFIYQHNPHLLNKINEPIFDHISDRLILANHSLKQLQIINEEDDSFSLQNQKHKYCSVLSILNKCVTPMGKREFQSILLNPTKNCHYLQKEYDSVEYGFTKYDDIQSWQSILKDIKDISKLKRQIYLQKISPKSICQLYQSIQLCLSLFQQIEKDEFFHSYLCVDNQISKSTFQDVIDFIFSHLDIDKIEKMDIQNQWDSMIFQKNKFIQLDEMENQILINENKIQSILTHFQSLIKKKEKSQSNDFIKIYETEKKHVGLIATNRRCILLENELPIHPHSILLSYRNPNEPLINPSYFEYTIQKGKINYEKQNKTNSFIQEPQIQSLFLHIQKWKRERQELLTKEYQSFLHSLGILFSNHIDKVIQFVSKIDVLTTKIIISKNNNYCKPTIIQSNQSFIDAKEMRHCLIEHLQENELHISNSISLGKENSQNGILLYGTNGVGKTCLIKAIGICIIMAQAGLYVPCKEFQYYPYQYLFTRILGNDNLWKGLSTFSVEMYELRTILKLSNENSLILGDELCSGTEIISATCIFVSGILSLLKKKASFIFATHLHEITTYEELQHPKLQCKHLEVVYDKEKDILYYDRKIKDGPGNSIYGLEVCKSLRLPDEFLQLAFSIRMNKYPEMNSLLDLKSSHFNHKKIQGQCEHCGLPSSEDTHHLIHQSASDENGWISLNGLTFHKNKLANLLRLCKQCHTLFHHTTNQFKKTKTSKGYKLTQLSNDK